MKKQKLKKVLNFKIILMSLFREKAVLIKISKTILIFPVFWKIHFSNFCVILKQNYFLFGPKIFQGKCLGFSKCSLPVFCTNENLLPGF